MPAAVEICSFSNSEEKLKEIAEDALRHAKAKGASGASLSISEGFSMSASVRAGRPEQISFNQGIGFGITVYLGKKAGDSSGNSLSKKDIETTVEKAIALGASMQEDECEGLPARDELARPPGPDLDTYDPWRPTVDEMVKLASEMAETSYSHDKRISREKSEGAGVSATESRGVFANSLGFIHADTSSKHSYACHVVADIDESMESSAWGIARKHKNDMGDHNDVANIAAKRAVDRAGILPMKSGTMPVLYEAGVSHALVKNLLGTLYGSRIYRKLSCHVDDIGKQVAAAHMQIRELPFKKRGMLSDIHDNEGVATQEKDIVKDGILQTHLLDCYSACKLNKKTTGNKGGVGNIDVGYKAMALADLLTEMGDGFFVTGLMGGGANPVTGDYSAGAYGFRIEKGAIAHPVKDATIAGNLKDMLKGVVAGGNDVLLRGGMECGSILVDSMTVGGSAAAND